MLLTIDLIIRTCLWIVGPVWLCKTGRQWNTRRPLAKTCIVGKKLRIQRNQTGRNIDNKIHHQHHRQRTTGKTHPRKLSELENHHWSDNPRQLWEKALTINNTTSTRERKGKKEEPIQKKQPRNKQNHRKFTNTNALQRWWDATTATKKDTSRECAAAKQTDNKRKQRVNYLEATHSEEEESEQEEIQQITQINRILPEKNDDHGIRLKINGKYQNFAIDTGSPSQSCQTTRSYTIKKVPTERKIPGREQEWNQFSGENNSKLRTQQWSHKTTDTNYTKKRHYTTTGCNLVKTTTNYH